MKHIKFGSIPSEVIEYVRSAFGEANRRVSEAQTMQPFMHEEMLDMQLVSALQAYPPQFFDTARATVDIQTHWLGGRRHYNNFEIADIALFVTISVIGKPVEQKVALLQTKRLYANEVDYSELDLADYTIGMGRLFPDSMSIVPPTQRKFSFDLTSRYKALVAGSDQLLQIANYVALKRIRVYYGLYNPCTLPLSIIVPSGQPPKMPRNEVGMHISSLNNVLNVIEDLKVGKSPMVGDLLYGEQKTTENLKAQATWRIEDFVAEEVLKCREGTMFDGEDDARLRTLLFGRSGPITSAIHIIINAYD